MKTSSKKIEVRYAETDQMGIVHHGSYVIWCELGRTQFIRDIGFNYADLEEMGILSPVTEISLQYKYPAVYGEEVTITTWIEHYDGLRIVYGYEIVNEQGKICVTGTSSHVCVKKENFKPISIRKQLPDWHAIYEREKKTCE
ncbi:acyl-CoA thioesterase [Bacillus alkalicellulosilyticus]|uniref:acyl-CoA thioesterase n=1 Tax=Alkalihalobacterium alkalicellulosilyticum TaxID=1912214 RepID=UPI000996575A|nr:thioesterase family protein [Bacillus alkalicellulosilyticus]